MKSLTTTLVGVFVFCSTTFASLTQKQFVVLFPSDSSSLDAAAFAKLDESVAFANSGQYFEVILDAYTDNDGTDQYNVELSRNRAVSVRNYLVSKGIDAKLVQVSWFGEKKPV